jgi:hypothetical protein
MAVITKRKVTATRATKLTGTANALTRGQGRKVGLKGKIGAVGTSGVKPILPVKPPARTPANTQAAPAPQTIKPFTAASAAGTGTAPAPTNILPIVKDFNGDLAAKWQKITPRIKKQAAARRDMLKLTGRANALTRGRGKKVGLKRIAPKPPKS